MRFDQVWGKINALEHRSCSASCEAATDWQLFLPLSDGRKSLGTGVTSLPIIWSGGNANANCPPDFQTNTDQNSPKHAISSKN